MKNSFALLKTCCVIVISAIAGIARFFNMCFSLSLSHSSCGANPLPMGHGVIPLFDRSQFATKHKRRRWLLLRQEYIVVQAQITTTTVLVYFHFFFFLNLIIKDDCAKTKFSRF